MDGRIEYENYSNLETKEKRDRIAKFIFVIVIIILLLIFYILGYKLGKIGYIEKYVSPLSNIKIIKVTDDNTKIITDTKLNIFKNEKFNGEEKIAPNSYGKYQFLVKNIAEQNMKYSLNFFDEATLPINMKYRLKIDNVYIRGSSKEYISIEDLNVDDIIVLKDSTNVFTLEWYWEDDDENDTYVGIQEIDQYYKLRIEINAHKYKK